MTSKRKPATPAKPEPQSAMSITGCNFTFTPGGKEAVEAAVALAHAAEANAKAIERVADMIKGPDGPAIQFTGR